jgi:ABC-type multidrug transport system ATPase subunit
VDPQLLKSLAEGRTVFVSSHLMGEIALMAEHRRHRAWRLIADASVDELVGQLTQHRPRPTPHASSHLDLPPAAPCG